MEINSTTQTLIVAHRGASYAAPENTLPAFELAFKENADFIEGDFWLTKDGQIVCIHDPHTARVAKNHTKLDIRNSTLSQLKQADVGSWKDRKFEGTTIPTLEEILRIIPEGKGIFIEIKDDRPEFFQKLSETLSSFSLPAEKIRLIAFDPKVIETAKSRFPKIKIYWLYNWYIAKETGRLSNSPREIIEVLKMLPCDGLNINPFPWIDIDFVRKIRRMNLDFCVYEVNKFEDALKLLTLGVDAIATNYPGKLRKEIEEYFAPSPLSDQKNERLEIDKNKTIRFYNNPQSL
ncbi:MAG: glycerophosphodiester phosphodiesterase [Calditrichaeota bacterium]|nr:glycerophosphodiester phosphodiesterase [Calditrichota bacterium]